MLAIQIWYEGLLTGNIKRIAVEMENRSDKRMMLNETTPDNLDILINLDRVEIVF
jgi:hypothetical protein